jgi:ribose-phosphate pyrophosphokinase
MECDIKLFTGTSNVALAQGIANNLSMQLSDSTIGRFPDGEIQLELLSNVRGCDAVIIQSTCPPINDSIMELMLFADALRRSAVNSITAVIPYYGYSRQDRRPGYSRSPISAAVVADMIQNVGITHVVLVDIHAAQTQGFFHIPTDVIGVSRLYIDDIHQRYSNMDDVVVCAPDVGGPLVVLDKRRTGPGQSEVMNIIGDVTGKRCILVDDIADSCGTIKSAANVLTAHGAVSISAYCAHGILSGLACSNLMDSSISELVITDSIPLSSGASTCPKIRQVTIAGILSDTILRVLSGQSVSELSN